MKFRRLLGIAMFVAGVSCLVWAIARGHASAWSAAAMCFCAAGVCLIERRKPAKEE